jgi:hypothetical protein
MRQTNTYFGIQIHTFEYIQIYEADKHILWNAYFGTIPFLVAREP